ncbi:AAA family ATPase [Sporosarcina limicola]|uniref:AAA15 family ATPase/GTPase n=1 Tax=Sporosarcina limicola TaxID=34101 RepID=A0A927REW4_9BACL|nr:AAA family ATPase [Sporosarcina limicola]MBE1556710.1 AAA15 family ATPase/GTPase [Sporosarcina limicola]
MTIIVRVTDVEINHLKNVKKGQFQTNSRFDTLNKADVVGFYGQNGSGKTAVVYAFKLVKALLSANQHQTLPELTDNLICFNEETIRLQFQFIVTNSFGEFFVKYSVCLGAGEKRLTVIEEEVSYRENEKNKRFKILVLKNKSTITVRNKKMNEMNEADRVAVMFSNKMAYGNATSFVFREELSETLDSILDESEVEIMKNLSVDFNRNLHVIDTVQYGLLIANISMPFSIHLENKRGHIPYEMQDTMVLPIELFQTIEQVIHQTNSVLQTIIPGLQIKVREINKQKQLDGGEGVRFEFLSKKGEVELPLRSESEGILKIISILSTLIAVYNNPNACVVIDELDAGIFEYLLGELLEVLSDNGKGQLIFTSHNLRILEVLPIRSLWFTTLNEMDRYLQLKGVKKLSNARDIYLRAVQLGGQDEAVYAETNLYDIKASFRKAGILHGGK